MTIEITVPTLPESVSDATVAKWYKRAGDVITRDENLVDLETDKVTLEVPAPKSGVLQEIKAEEGSVVNSGQVLAIIAEGDAPAAVPAATDQTKAADDAKATEEPRQAQAERAAAADNKDAAPGPAARRAAQERDVDVSAVSGSGKDGRVTRGDVEQFSVADLASVAGARSEKRVPMSRLRARIAERLVEVQQNAALLTTFNEINMQPCMDLRSRYKDAFEKQYGVRLGFMSFFTKACVEALKRYPEVNASIDGNDVVYHNFYDVGIAIGSPRGLVVPILRNAEHMSMADVEAGIKVYAGKARDGKLAMEDMTGGTFTITNGGVYGSMMSTPIINPPQTAILGMHNIVQRAVVEEGQIIARPMMYVALSYDHRVIDGQVSVTFLKTVKELIEDPARLILGV
jgi:2-oxoglutarate dehydrogenase E2 component (dihydrolipoamide succinyltransferase)